MTSRLSPPALKKARRYALAQVPDSQILGALRAEARQNVEPEAPPEALVAVLASLQAMHDADVDDLNDHRDLGIATVKLLIAAAAFGEKLNSDLEVDEFGSEVDGKACSMLQFMGRVFCCIDPAELREEAAREAKRMADMPAEEVRSTLIAMCVEVGIKAADLELKVVA